MGRVKNRIKNLKARAQAIRVRAIQGTHRSFRITPRVKKPFHIKASVAEAWRLAVETNQLVWQHKKIFLLLIAIYTVVTYLLVGGISQQDYAALKEEAINYSGGLDAITTALGYFGATITGGLTVIPSELQQLLTGIITLLFWLSTIWATRMLLAGKSIKLRDAFYSGPTPLISTLVVLVGILIQLIPAALGLFALTTGLTQGWISNLAVALAYGLAAIMLCLLSLYWLSGSAVAAAIVALPGMYPLQAFRDSRALVMGRRWSIVMRIISIMLLMLLIWAVILIPMFMLDSWLRISWLPLVPITVQVLVGSSLIFSSVYIYKLYRSLL